MTSLSRVPGRRREPLAPALRHVLTRRRYEVERKMSNQSVSIRHEIMQHCNCTAVCMVYASYSPNVHNAKIPWYPVFIHNRYEYHKSNIVPCSLLHSRFIWICCCCAYRTATAPRGWDSSSRTRVSKQSSQIWTTFGPTRKKPKYRTHKYGTRLYPLLAPSPTGIATIRQPYTCT